MNMLSSNVLCMKKRKKKSYCVSNVSDYGGKYRDKRGHSGVTMLHITEDTPPDMLAGAMDLTVHLPNGRQVKMSVERSTPMMDVLVQITTAHHLQLSSHSIQALGLAPSSQHNDKVLPYKPNTPIGTLDTQYIRVIPKGRSLPVPKNVPPGHQPFVSTFRLRVHLPRNQLYVSRVSMNARLEDIMKEVCDEKNLDQSKYEFRHPGNLDQVLDLKLTLNDYQITEIHFVSKGNSRLSQAFSANDIMALRKDEERKQSKSGGVFNLIFKRSKTSNGSGSVSSDNRSISPTHSDDSRSVTPPGVQQVISSEKPKAPQRKRRPAPKPPAKEETRNIENQMRKTESGLTICHSRNSSDSSGYHEASILSDNANTSLPRRPQTLMMSREADKLNGVHSKSTSNLSSMSSKSKSTSSLAFAGRKKKAPPPPPVLNAACSVDNLEASPVVESPVEQSESLPPAQENNLQTQVYSTNSPPESIASSLATTLSSNIETDLIPSKENSEIVENEKPVIERMKEIQPMLEPIKIETPKEGDINDLETEWQYQLPSPPTAFRDASPVTENLTNYESTETDHFKPDSVITSPELFEKLKLVKEAKSEISENQSEDDKPILNKLSLENLEKRKSLVYNRELATSLKYKDDESTAKSQKTDSISSKRSSVISELEEVINHPKPNNLIRSNSKADNFIQIESSLPNFKITTYDMPKKKINIFEDDSIRSNSETNNNIVKTPEDTNLYKKSEDVFKKPQEINKYRSKTMARSKTTDNCLTRSESFSMSNWVPANPVKRSKSQVGISEYIEEEKKMSKSNSLFDVSGLQSLEVIRNIQMKLKQEKEIKNNIEKAKDVKEKAKTVSQSQPYVSRGPPSINLGTWSERPKSQISLKEDTDYKFNTANLKPNETSIKPVEIKRSTFKQTDFNGVNVRVNASDEKTNVSIKVNGSETISSQPSGNVVIKIGGSEQSNNEDFSKRFINHTTAVGYRKPLGNINKVSTRPHSIAYDDVSRLPIVRSVELKKPFKDNQVNTSITQINGETKQQSFTNSQVYVTSEPIRLNSFNQAPVVKGFKQSESNKNMWNSYKTLPMKPTPKMDTPTTNQNVAFSQRNLRRTESIKNTPTSNNNNINNNNNNSNSNVFDHVVLRNTQNSFNNNNNNKRFSTGMMSNINLNNNIKNVEKPPPPPIMPKVNGFSQNKRPEKMVVDPRGELLSAIRDFGGKKGLKAVKI